MSEYQNPETCDHLLSWDGMYDGYAGFTLLCIHPSNHFRVDEEGVEHEECLVQQWHDELGEELIQASQQHPYRWAHRKLRLFSHWNPAYELTLLGAGEHDRAMQDYAMTVEDGVWKEEE